ncbi:hypothetical protein PF003_g30984 [Phytophthora fragariae]|nr:hypothetical protein PF003_g30984 [Phytophthora fragariae]
MTTLRRCWPRWSWRSPRRRLSLSPPTWRRLRRCCSSRTALWRCWPQCSWRRLRRCGSSMTTLRRCWPRWSWRWPRRRL